MNHTSRTFFGFALADSMFGDQNLVIDRQMLKVEDVAGIIARGVTSCCNPSHESTVKTMRQRFGLYVPIPVTPPRVELSAGDAVIVMGVRGLPRLTDRHEYTDEEVAKASFVFSMYTVRQRAVPYGFTRDLSHINQG
ncbi:MAG: hypothetical protein KBC21_02335 [Candidatus Pacebacteria bacterium]|nr:hypothetical protein [Candidatus Paceibacterota bacterium]